MAVLMSRYVARVPTTTCSKMAYPNYRPDLPAFVTTAADERQHYANTPVYQNPRLLAPEPWVPTIPGVTDGPPTHHVGIREGYLPSNDVYPPRHSPSPMPRRNLQITTDSNAGVWSRRNSEVNLVQSPSTYSPLSPSFQGVPSLPRRKIVDITLDGINYTRVDITRHVDARAIRRDMCAVYRLSPASYSNLDIFRTHPPGWDRALDDGELMLDIEHFGDDQGTLKFLLQTASRYSDSYLPTCARTTPTPSPHSTNFSAPSFATSPRYPVEWHGPEASTSGTRGYTRSSTQTPNSRPANRLSMPMPIPSPAPMWQPTEPETPEFPTPTHSTGYTSPARFAPFTNATGHDGQYHRRDSTTDSRPGSVVIDAAMTTEEVLSHLYQRGCRNVSRELDESRTSTNPVARGGGGDVYSGELYTGERVALKCVRLAIGNEDRSKLKKTAHELYVWSKCKHPNVLELLGVTHHRDQVAMVSPWMENGDLRAFLRLYPETNRQELVRVFMMPRSNLMMLEQCVQMADGVAYLHGQNIVHGDIKGANVLISQSGEAKITDFGTSALKEYTLEFAQTGSRPGLSIRWA
ncbi:unnamed protein product, partial [Rhizoctonia solani]